MNNFDAIKIGSKILKSNNIKSYILDSELLLAKILNSSREHILTNQNNHLKSDNFKKYKKLILRRKNNEPIAYILKRKGFWKFNFNVSSDVMIPRPETELIVQEVLKIISYKKSKKILDVGTGSGCIIISILKERQNCKATAIDISKKALKIAITNAKMHHLKNKISFINIDVDKFNHNKYDLVISNPPYINKICFQRLDDDVKNFEPKIALEGGTDGFREIKKLIFKSSKLLKKGGNLIFEIGMNQSEHSKYLLYKNGFYINKICKDLNSINRVIVSTKIS